MTKAFPQLPCGKEMFPVVMPWVRVQMRYTGEDVLKLCTDKFRITPTELSLKHPSGKPVWTNYVAWTLAHMTRLGFHRDCGDHYEANLEAIDSTDWQERGKPHPRMASLP